jgi:hypothetical protein
VFALVRSALVLSILSLPIFGDYLRVLPIAPDSNDRIVADMGGIWRDGCTPQNPRVTRAGNTISIELELPKGGCPTVLTPWEEQVELGILGPGVYNLAVYIVEDPAPPPPWASIQFAVTDAEASHTLTPNAGPSAGGTEVLVLGTLGTCPFAPPCVDPQVLFGGVPATAVRQVTGGLIAVTPPHAPGIVDVEIKGLAGQTVGVLPAAFTYQGPGIPSEAAYTPVLIPLIFRGPGALGSQWVTRASFYNESSVAITPLNRDAVSTCPPNVSPCPAPPFAGNAWDEFHHGASYQNGLILWLPRNQVNDIDFSLHVRDITRAGENLGTELPVIREEELLSGDVHLLNIPVADGFRYTLRVYDLGFKTSRRVFVSAFSPANESVASITLELQAADEACLGGPVGCTPNLPRYAAIQDFVTPSGTDLETIRLVIHPESPEMRIWAFVSVTSNSTSQITTITPQ